jgi:tetrahydromethanopterin S-methyltransferase subunit F
VDLRFGRHAHLQAEMRVTPAGLLAIGALVSGIILSVAPLVWSARRRPY